jgi:hypothetical protein
MLPATSTAMPSTPSSIGFAYQTCDRHSVLGVNVVSQPWLASKVLSRFRRTRQIAPRALSAM